LESRDCLDSAFLYDCRGCKNCFLCWNLRNAEYYIANKKYTPEDYQKEIAKYNFGSWQGIKVIREKFLSNLKAKAIFKNDLSVKTIDCGGNYMTECKKCLACYFGETSEDFYNVIRFADGKDVFDSVGAYHMELSYLISQSAHCYNVRMTSYAVRCRDSEYLDQCEDCSDCFGCVGLRKKKFCILNKQYSEEEYGKLVVQIKEKMRSEGEYGQFFPLQMMYNGYNDTLAHFYFPENRESIEAKGSSWQEEEAKDIKPDLKLEDLPDDIKNVREEAVVGKSVKCPKTGKVFRYIPQELKFYQANNIPLPRYYYNYRLTENFHQLAPLSGREASCGKCGKKITTYYPAEWGYQNIYCEECYQKEIY